MVVKINHYHDTTEGYHDSEHYHDSSNVIESNVDGSATVM